MTDHDPRLTDSAGTPWAGRRFEPNRAADDDGSAPPLLADAVRRFRAGDAGEAAVVDALREVRLLVPLIAELGDHGVTEAGHVVDKSQELSIVTVAGPDGRTVQPAFSSVAAMAVWNPEARPVPVPAVRVALAAAAEDTLVVVDPRGEGEFALRRPAIWALGQGAPWSPSYLDAEVLQGFMTAAGDEPAVLAVQLAPGDPDARLAGPELIVHLTLEPGLDRAALDALLARLQERWATDAVIAERVDSLAVKLAAAPLSTD